MSTSLPSLERMFELQPQIPQALRGLVSAAERGGLDRRLISLAEVRASQLNGCSFCLDMHCRIAREHSIDQQLLDVLPAWRETTFFSAREQAALAWCEALTSPEDKLTIERVRPFVLQHLNEAELVNLSAVIVAINGWNRLVAGFGVMPQRKAA